MLTNLSKPKLQGAARDHADRELNFTITFLLAVIFIAFVAFGVTHAFTRYHEQGCADRSTAPPSTTSPSKH
jgi:hypothetical protein